MSYDIYLEYRNKDSSRTIAEVDRHEDGGTYALGGTPEAHLNITYNYGWFYYRFLDTEGGIRWLYGKKAKNCIKRLERAVEKLGTDVYRDYWAPTPGNAGYALSILLKWAKQHPEAVFDGD